MSSQDPTRRAVAFRPDVEGLRAVAVLLVLLFHAGVPALPGGFAGVDVFFVISGFLITTLLVAEAQATGTVALRRFWARRARRLLPASALVILVTALLTLAVLPMTRWREVGWDLIAAAAYVLNWRLADRSVDYLAEDSVPSPVQHYWSLAVEEQFYLVWPLLVLAVTWWAGRAAARARGERSATRRRLTSYQEGVLVVGLVVVLPSLLLSVWAAGAAPAWGYLATPTRLWQLGAGALLALVAGRLRGMPPALATALGWGGLAAVLLGAVLHDPTTPWPGTAALVPTLGTVAVLAAGLRLPRQGAGRLLALPPLQWLGGMSYSLYLWHWPLLVMATARWGELSVGEGLAVVAASVVPAWLGHRLVEQPLRRRPVLVRRPLAALALGLACTLVGVGAGGALIQQVDQRVRAGQEAAGNAAGAGALLERRDDAATTSQADGGALRGDGAGAGAALGTQAGRPVPDGTAGAPPPGDLSLDPAPPAITPDPLVATGDIPALYPDGCDAGERGEMVVCGYGDPEGGLVLAVVGDSKMAQWGDALDRLGRERHWRVDVYYRSACPWSTARRDLEDRDEVQACLAWGQQVTDHLLAQPPDVVLTSTVTAYGIAAGASGAPTAAAMAEGHAQRWQQLGDAGIPVVAVADTPQPGGLPVYECVAEHRDDVGRCTIPFNDGSGTQPLREAVAMVPTSTFVTMNDWVCPGQDACPPVVGGVLVYRQGSHITSTYAVSLAEVLGARLEAAFDRLGVAAPKPS